MVKNKNRLANAGKEWINEGHSTLDSYVKIVQDFKIIPDEEFAEVNLFSFKGEKVKAKRIKDQLCMNQKQLSKYIDVTYNNVKVTFHRIDLQEGKHYFNIRLQNVTHTYLTLLGCLLLTKRMRKGFAEQFFTELSEHIYNNMNPITISELLLINKEKKLIPQYLGDPDREWVAEDFDILESRGEMIIDNILFKLKIPHQPKPRIRLPPELEEKFNRTYPIVPDWNIKMLPRTIIEYWGRDGPKYVKLKEWKQEMYKALNISIINIEPAEVQNIPILTKKLKDLLS
ncbi:hypothetical protein LCGC14_1065390 [marine sediment metagenome]|uniref:Uncharacterized protein n=1 Tax=marine sediment metagenome TaxID=412755 RepID=A0A0F9QQN8_9ZZZZ